MGEVKQIKKVTIEKLIPYENNAKRHPEEQIAKIADSIIEFGFLSPILIDKEFNIIAGHGRLLAAQKAGLSEVPCAFVEGLSEPERRAYILADNRLSEFGSWDKDLVNFELNDLSEFDLGFNIDDFEFPEVDLDDGSGYYGDERERTNKAYNLDIAHDTDITTDFWQMPIIENQNYAPSKLLGFNYAKTSKDKAAGIHFFIDDYQFERIWNDPEKYVDILKEYECILTPDFSLYMDMPMPMKIWNVYRSRQIGAYYQKQGLTVIPTISWAEPETYCFCFEGVPEGSIVAVSTVGVNKNKKAREIYIDGLAMMIEKISPSKILVYGSEIEADYQGVDTVCYQNEVTKKWKK